MSNTSQRLDSIRTTEGNRSARRIKIGAVVGALAAAALVTAAANVCDATTGGTVNAASEEAVAHRNLERSGSLGVYPLLY